MKSVVKIALFCAVLLLIFNSQVFAEGITIKGSTTVLPIAQAAAEEFMDNNPKSNISVQGGGSGVGIAALIDSTCDIADSSRSIKDSEIEKAVSNGVDPRVNVIAMDGIAVVVNFSNSVKSLTKKQLKDIYMGKISNWSEVGGSGGQIVVVSRDSASGTYEAFGELALEKEKLRPDALLQASNQAVATTVAKTPSAIGYVGLGYLSKDLKVIPIDGVEATKDTVLSGKYPLSRPLFMYTNGRPKGLVKEFIDFVLSKEGQKLVEENGYVALQ
ncbi:MAG: phosphate ABC transporter substrate-binding protein [Candidatus Omnitrophica bacterium]|nr:phosphate ABC transporter substrate-binding protein [Candidatus Omnitrophota bacterium]